jgi:leucyl/phenylalanyl-tRNA--protein transferase
MIFDLDGTPVDAVFPDATLAEEEPNGLLAIGGDLRQKRLLHAYRQGIFPWYSAGQPILWWSPAPRMVLFPPEFHMSRSLRKSFRTRHYEVSANQAFDEVIHACAEPRDGTAGTWLVPDMVAAYSALHQAGHAHSVETWHGDRLVGGLYGVAIGQAFFGESMFSRSPDASKVAMAMMVQIAQRHPFQFIDCQVHTDHLASLGAREISRDAFQRALRAAVEHEGSRLKMLERRSASTLGPPA